MAYVFRLSQSKIYEAPLYNHDTGGPSTVIPTAHREQHPSIPEQRWRVMLDVPGTCPCARKDTPLYRLLSCADSSGILSWGWIISYVDHFGVTKFAIVTTTAKFSEEVFVGEIRQAENRFVPRLRSVVSGTGRRLGLFLSSCHFDLFVYLYFCNFAIEKRYGPECLRHPTHTLRELT